MFLQIDGKCIDVGLARKQHADLVKSLRDKTGLDVLELPPDESNALSVFTQVNHTQCQAKNVGFELYICIESKLSISIIGFDLELGEFCHDFHSISIPINHSGTHFNLPAISTSLK